MKRFVVIFGVSLLAVMTLSACLGAQVSDVDTAPQAAAVQPAEQQEVDAADLPTEVPQEAEMPESESEPEQAEAVAESPPPVLKAGLEATDPGTVSLASGDVQLIELFAYW